MEIINKANTLTNKLTILKKNKSIGFVPTMGALHKGHLSLIHCASNNNDIVVVSIFVNPTQFNNNYDLKNYPRNFDKDIEILKNVKCDILFLPNENEIYPNEESTKIKYDFGHLTTIMEGKFRHSHFDGVALVVSKLFNIVKPNNAYFGQKDFQQFIIIKHLADKFLKHLNICIINCPIIREKDGLAMSSRNVRLDDKQRKSSILISKTLFYYKNKYKKNSVNSLKKKIKETINEDNNLNVEYIEIVTSPEMKIVDNWDINDKVVICIAVFVGNVRLIDNIYLNNY